MAPSTTTKGICQFCHKEFAKGGISRHLQSCRARQAAIAKAEKSKRKPESLYHLRVQSCESKVFWLDLEMRGSKSVKDLDFYLREIWLECCGHLSEFFSQQFFGREITMGRKIEAIFQQTDKLFHIYDMGTSSETIITHVGQRLGKPLSTKPIFLMARNQMPAVTCIYCELPATHLCMECVYEDDTTGLLCDRHTENHPHDNYGEPVALVNSPRLGMCGYEGPADPPY